MLKVFSAPLELRGIANETSKKGNVFYIIHAEDMTGCPHSLYCPKREALPDYLKKGDHIRVEFEVTKYNNQERLVVTQVNKVGDAE